VHGVRLLDGAWAWPQDGVDTTEDWWMAKVGDRGGELSNGWKNQCKTDINDEDLLS